MTTSNTLLFALYILIPTLWLAGCGSAEQQKKSSGTDAVDSRQKSAAENKSKQNDKDTVFIERKVRGETVRLNLDGQLNWSKEYEGHEYPLTIKELQPGVVLFDRYHEETISYDDGSTYSIERAVPDKIEFLDDEGRLLTTFDVDDHNPYLQPGESIEVIQYYDNAERTYYLPESKRTGEQNVDQYYVRTVVEGKGAYSCIHYKAKQLTEEGLILGIKSTMVVLDTTGRQLFELEVDRLTSMPAITKDGKYLMFSFLPIETTSNAGVKTQVEGFEIWNILQKKRIYREENSDPDMWVSTPSLDENSGIIRLRYTFPNSEEIADKIYLFNPDNLELYYRLRSNKESREVAKRWFSYYKSYKKVLKEFNFDTLKLYKNE